MSMINKSSPWDKHDDSILKRLYPHDRMEEISEILGRSIKSIYQRAHILNINRSVGGNQMGYHVRVLRAKDNLIFYEKMIPPSDESAAKKNKLIKMWQEKHFNKLVTGEWIISVINGYENFM